MNASRRAPALRITYRTTTKRVPVAMGPDGRVAPPSTEEAEVVVVLADQWQSTRDGATESIVDFDRGLIHAIDHARGTVATQSIHARVAFREQEIENRLMLGRVTEAGGATLGSRADMEASLGVEAHPPKNPRFRSPWFRENSWKLGSTIVATCEPSGHRASSRALRRWLAHDVMLHPRLADVVASRATLPGQLYHRHRLFPEHYERTWTLASVESIDVDLDARLEGHRPTPPFDEAHARVQAMLRGGLPMPPDRRAIARAALAEGRHLEAVLALVSHTFATSDDCSQDFAAVQERLSDRESAYGFLLAMPALDSGEGLDVVLRFFDTIEPEAGSQRHVLDVVRARALLQLTYDEGDGRQRSELRAQAHAALLRAIDGDPTSVMAYQDLGNYYIGAWAMNVAWDCWAVARMLAPGHTCVQTIEANEQRHRDTHPQFF